MKIFEEFEKKIARYEELQKLIADPKVISDKALFRKYTKELSDISGAVMKYNQFLKVKRELDEVEGELERNLVEPDYIELAQSEKKELEEKVARLAEDLEELLLEKDPHDDKNVIMEIRAGTGGIEAGLFAGDLFRMYSKYASRQGWKVEMISSNPTEKGGFKEVIFSISGRETFGKLKFESGTHRVQRVPETEASGRIHTSAATVAVLPEAGEVEVQINQSDLKIDVFRAGGRGGQHVNVTDSAVRITHLSTGLVVSCQDERSQHKNKTKAMKVLRARILEKRESDRAKKISADRKKQVGSGDRSEKIRTYNFPENRVTDHRIGLVLYKLEAVLEGGLDELITGLKKSDRSAKLGKK